MSVAIRSYTPDERRLQHRDDALHEMLWMTAGRSGLSNEAEMDIRRAVGRQIEPLLQLADSAVSLKVELDAVDAGLTRHRQGCRLCCPERACLRYRLNDIRRTRLQRRYDAAFVKLLRGGR